MAKRYHQSRKDRMDERKGMDRRLGEYAGYDAKRRQELEDSGMIHEDHSAVANLPQEVMMKPWPKRPYLDYELDDTIREVDDQMGDDVRGARKHRSKTKY